MYRQPLNLKQRAKTLKHALSTSSTTKLPIPEHWADFARLCKIRSGNKVIQFEPYPYQIILSNLIDNHFGTVIAKTRQLGITESIACKFLHKACKNTGYVAVILSKSQSDSSNIAKRIRRMVDGISQYVDLATDSLTDLQIKNGGRILFRPSTPNGTRGLESVSDIMFDECAFVDDVERIYTSAIPSTEMVGNEARIIILSTPNGKSGFYWDRLTSGNPSNREIETVCNLVKSRQIDPIQYWTDENEWCKFILHWLAHPIYSQVPNYLEEIKVKKQLTTSAVEQEYNLSFESSEVNIFPSELVKQGSIGKYLEPERNSEYYMGIDTSTVGDDYTVGIILKQTRFALNVVNIYRKRKHSMEYNIEALSSLINLYKPVKIGVEVTGGTGQIYLEQLTKLHYASQLEAIKTTTDSKVSMIDRVLLCLEKRELTYPSDCPLVEELLCFRRSGKKLAAPSGKHDDSVMALAFAISVSPVKKESYNVNWLKNL